jgi:hypothetical protein
MQVRDRVQPWYFVNMATNFWFSLHCISRQLKIYELLNTAIHPWGLYWGDCIKNEMGGICSMRAQMRSTF